MELASKRFHEVLSGPSAIALGKFSLDLRKFCPHTPERFRWFKRRIRRYQHIQGRFSDDLLMWTYDIDVGHVPPLLPSLLVTCAPSAELSLTVHACEGQSFLEIYSNVPGNGSELDQFWANLIQHLGSLSMLTALRRLQISSRSWASPDNSLAVETVALKLPNLASLNLIFIVQGEFDLSCPNRSELSVLDSSLLHIMVENAALKCLWLAGSKNVHFYLSQDQIASLYSLYIRGRDKAHRHLTEDVCHRRGLERLQLLDFPSEIMPKSFPQRLRDVRLESYDWRKDLPGGLKDLRNLEVFHFKGARAFWDITRPLEEYLPIPGLKSLTLGTENYSLKKLKNMSIGSTI